VSRARRNQNLHITLLEDFVLPVFVILVCIGVAAAGRAVSGDRVRPDPASLADWQAAERIENS